MAQYSLRPACSESGFLHLFTLFLGTYKCYWGVAPEPVLHFVQDGSGQASGKKLLFLYNAFL